MWRTFFCAMLAAVTLKFLDPFGTGKIVLFQVTYDKDWHAYELFFFLLLGVFGVCPTATESLLNDPDKPQLRVSMVLISLVSTTFGVGMFVMEPGWANIPSPKCCW